MTDYPFPITHTVLSVLVSCPVLMAGSVMLLQGGYASAQTAPLIPPPQDLLPPTSPAPVPVPQPLPAVPPVELPVPPVAPVEPIAPGTIPGTIVVQRFEVVGSTVFSQAELAQVTAPFTNRPISFAALLQVQTAVTRLYTDRGYITSGAIISPQTLEAGVVQIRVVEGSLEAITVSGTQRLNPNYVRSRLAVAAGKPLNSQRLLESLQLLQLNPLIRSISAELSTGVRPGQNRLDVRVTEADTLNAEIGLDNSRSPAVSTFRRYARITQANLLGLGDSLSIGYANTDGSHVGDFTYTLPLNPRDGTVSVGYRIGASRIVEEPFDQIDITSKSRSLEVTLRQPLFRSPSQEFVLGLTASREESDTAVLGVPLQLSPGADQDGKTKISALRFFQKWTDRTARSVFALRSQLSLGLNAFDATINDTAPDSRFFAWRGQVQWARLLAPDTLLVLQSDLQIADRALVPLEQFSLGGQERGRGYRQDLLLTDSGWFGSAEVRLPILRIPRISGVLQITPFLDLGNAWNARDRNPDPNFLAAVGFGLRWQQGDRLSARLDWGIPLVSVDSQQRTWQENGVYFSLVYRLF
jgi:hemolysin activation/secretion protein